MSEEKKKDECCSTTKSGCGCGCVKKVIVMTIAALLLFGFGYCVGKGNFCKQSKMCPITGKMANDQTMMQK